MDGPIVPCAKFSGGRRMARASTPSADGLLRRGSHADRDAGVAPSDTAARSILLAEPSIRLPLSTL